MRIIRDCMGPPHVVFKPGDNVWLLYIFHFHNMPYQHTSDLQKKANVSAINIVPLLGDWSTSHKDTLSFNSWGGGGVFGGGEKKWGRECLVPKGYGVWWNKLIFNLMMWGNTLQWHMALTYNDCPGNLTNFYRSSRFQHRSTWKKQFEKNRDDWIIIALE